MTGTKTKGPPRDPDAHDAPDAKAAAKARQAKGSVIEAIGKLIGDDKASERGSAEQRAAAKDADVAKTSPRP